MAVFLEGRLVPLGAELVSASNVRYHENVAALEPTGADAPAVPRCQGRLKAAVAVDERRILPVGTHRGARDLEIGDPGPVLRDCLELLGLETVRPEERREGLEPLGGPALDAAERERRGCDEIGDREPELVRVIGIDGLRRHGAEGRSRRECPAGPHAVLALPE